MPLDKAIKRILQDQLGFILIIRTKDERTTEIKQFLAQLNSLLDDHSDEVIALLKKQNMRHGCTMGHIIAYYQTDPTVLQNYLTLLEKLMAKNKTAAITLLELHTKDGWTIGYFIARDQKSPEVALAYLKLLQDLMDQDLQAATRLLQQENKDGLNAGHFIAQYQKTNPLVIQTYLTILQDLMKKKPSEAIQLLQRQDSTGWTLGHCIALFQTDPAVLKMYLTLLKTWMMDNPSEESQLLQQTTKEGWTIGDILASERAKPEVFPIDAQSLQKKNIEGWNKALQAYLDFLTDLITNSQITNSEAMAIQLLQQPNKEGRNIGHLITRHQAKPEILLAYLNILDKLMDKNPSEAIKLLLQKDNSDWTIGHIIARHQTKSEILLAYLKILDKLIEKNPSAAIQLLQQQDHNAWTIGHILACYQQSQEVPLAYLTLLQLLKSKDLPATISLLQLQINEGSNTGHILARYQTDSKAFPYYLQILQDLITKDLPGVIKLLQQKNNAGWNTGHILTTYQPQQVITQYLSLLSEGVSQTPVEIFALLTTHRPVGSNHSERKASIKTTGVNIGDSLTDKQQIKAYNKIFLGAFLKIFNSTNATSVSVNVADYIEHSEKITKLLLDLPPTVDTLKLLRQCLDNTTPIGKYCHTSTGSGLKSACRGETTMVTKISARHEEIIAAMAKEPNPAVQGMASVVSSVSDKSVRRDNNASQMLELAVNKHIKDGM